MAEQLDLNINIGANTQNLQAELQKAQNLLGQFQAALKKATNVGEINYLSGQVKNLQGVIVGLQTQMGNTAKKTGDATQSLINLSRVAQDAPYGFIGIANNINPLLESFQRLQTQTGSTTKALGSMVAGIAGPAGIGLAVGVATSLLTVYSKEIADFFKSPTDKLKEFREELKKTNQEVYKIVGEIQANRAVGLNLVNLITGGNATQQQEALKRLKALYSDNKAIQDAKVGNDKQFYINLVNAAAKQKEALGKEENNTRTLSQLYDKQNELEDERNKKLAAAKDIRKTISTGAGAITTVFTAEQQRKQINAEYDKSLALIRTKIQQAELLNAKFLGVSTGVETADKKGGKAADPLKEFSQNLKSENNAILQAIQRRKELGKTASYIKMETPQDKASAERKRKSDIAAFGKQQMTGELGDYLQGKTSVFYEEQKKINEQKALDIKITKEQTEANIQLADTLSNYVANSFMNLFSAMQQGQSIGEALKNVFIGIAEQIAFAAIKAAAFTAILNLIPGMQGVSEALGGFKGIFTKILGLASGGIVTGPTLAMVGEGNESEAVMPLSKLGNLMNNTFNAGAMASNGGGGNGEFVLRGQDLVLALNRSETALKYRRG